MSLSQEHIATLRQEITMVTHQIQLISGPEFTDTVPEVAAAKAALERYKRAAEEHVAEWDSAHQPPVQSRLLNLGAFKQYTGMTPTQYRRSQKGSTTPDNPA